MAKSISISKDYLPHKSMDYDALRKEGIEYLQQYSGGIWTDYNHHDPGVTVLEYLCFGITDLGYRGNFPITDLLYARENRRIVGEDNAFIPPEKILPCSPLTLEDYRRLLLDRLADQIDNLWISPVADAREGVNGLYDIWLQRSEKAGSAALAPEDVIATVRREFTSHRNLCEDIRTVYILEQEELEVEATINLDMDAPSEQVAADIIFKLDHFLAPKIQFRSFEEMRERGHSINELLDGPEPKHGFIEASDLKPMTSVLYRSQLRDIISATRGVRSLEQIRLKLNSLPQFSEELIIPKNSYFVLSEAMRGVQGKPYPIRFLRNGQIVTPNFALMNQILGALMAREYQQFHQKVHILQPPAVPNKDLSDIAAYYSIQRFFPGVYGIGAFGLPRDSNFFRQAQARQLKGYLAIFEIMLASGLKQLTEVKRLFSIGKPETEEQADDQSSEQQAIGPSYFAQFPFDIPDIEPLLAVSPDQSNPHQAVNEQLARNTALKDPSLDRRNEFLDHLLARFGEVINADLLQASMPQLDDYTELQRQLIDLKCRVLRDYANLSRNRGKGFDYLQPTESESGKPGGKNVSGLKKRLYYWLHLGKPEDRPLTDYFPFDNFALQQSSAKPDTQEPLPGLPMRTILRDGRDPENYSLENKNQNWEVYFHGNSGSKPCFLLQAPDEAAAQQQLDEFILNVQDFDQRCTGFHLIEHILLRPQHKKGFKLRLSLEIENKKQVFESLYYISMEELEGLAEDLLMIASDKRNYSKPLPDGNKFFILLQQDKRPVLASVASFEHDEAVRIVEESAKLMQHTLRTHPGEINNWIDPSPEIVKGFEIDQSFYPHRFSIVLPDWPSRFAEENFRLLFKKLVAQNVPAHLQVDLLWLNWGDMQAFEERYLKWLESKRDDVSDHQIDELAFDLVAQLTQNSPMGDDVAKWLKEESSHDLSAARYNAILAHSGFSFLFKPTDLEIIQGIDTTTAYRLKKANISTWTLLAVANEDQIKQIQWKAGLSDYAWDVASWKEQAALAAAAQWDALEPYQEQYLLTTATMDMLPGYKSKLQQVVETRPKSKHD